MYASLAASLFLYLVRQCAKKRGRREANHLLTLTLMLDVLAFLEIIDKIECLLLVSPERRCSSRTFRYGYLVTT